MKILVFGHSYVRDLSRFGPWDCELELENGEKVPTSFEFKAYPGKDFAYFLSNPGEVSKILDVDPDVVIVVLGGNSVTAALSNIQINEQARAFYTLLKAAVKPSCLKLAVQVEPRFVSSGNRHRVPEASEFNRRRQTLNNYLNKNLKRQGLVDRVILLGSVNYLNHPQYFRDGVHLSGAGLERYKETVLDGLRYALARKQ